jgi:SsrA-binding protein
VLAVAGARGLRYNQAPMAKKPAEGEPGEPLVCRNTKTIARYVIDERFEAGMVLTGSEVKSLRERQADLESAYARIERGELVLHKMFIGPYQQATAFAHEPKRPRKLLAHRHEIEKLTGKLALRGYTLLPVQVYFQAGSGQGRAGAGQGQRRRRQARGHQAQARPARGQDSDGPGPRPVRLPARTQGGDALSLIAFDGKHFRFVSPRAFAPGQPLNVRIDLARGVFLELKSLGSVRRAEGDFEVRARATTLSRSAREALLSGFASD